jgi:hypothetical protein
MITTRSLCALLLVGLGLFCPSRAVASPSPQDLLLTADETPEGYAPQPQPVDDTLGTLTMVRDWMFGGGAQNDPPNCTAELSWFISFPVAQDSAAITIWGPQILLADGIGKAAPGHSVGELDSHIETCKKIRVTSGAVVVDAALERQQPPATAASSARGFKETVTFTLGAFQQTRVVIGFYGMVRDMAAAVVGGSRDMDPAAVSTDTITAVVSDIYARQVMKIDKSGSHK